MIVLCAAFAFFSKVYVTFCSDIVQPISLMSVQVGESVTLECFVSKEETGYVSWYKQPVGKNLYLVFTSHKNLNKGPTFHEKFRNTRFKLKLDAQGHHLVISQTEASDSGFYYCGIMRAYSTIFGSGTLLTVKAKQKSENRTVVQQLVSDPVHPGDSVTLQCTVEGETCAGEHSVYWFRHGSGESLPGLIYTHGNRSDQCDKSPEAGSPTHSCVYSLPKRNLSPSDAGTYYCAVVTCGDILFGKQKELDIKEPAVGPLIAALGVSLFVCLIIIFVLLCIRNKKACCEHCRAGVSQQVHHDGSKTEVISNEKHEAELQNYAALHFADTKQRNGRKKRELKEETVYSHVKYQEWD